MNLDTLYEDFTTRFLPQIQEGLVITKDYAFDLFDRYITYLIIIDSLLLMVSLVSIPLLIYIAYRINKAVDDVDKGAPYILLILLILPIMILFCSGSNLLMDLTIPEIRVYQLLNK